MVTMPPDVVLMRASSTVFVKASSLVKRDLADIFVVSGATQMGGARQLQDHPGRFRRVTEVEQHGRKCDGTEPRSRSGGRWSGRWHGRKNRSIGLDHGAEQLRPASQVG
jgi:hypothetical protein